MDDKTDVTQADNQEQPPQKPDNINLGVLTDGTPVLLDMTTETEETIDLVQQQPVNKWGVPLLPNGKPDYDAIEQQPDRWRVYGGGTVYGIEEGHIVAKDNTDNPKSITAANSLDMHKRRALLELEAQESARIGIAQHLGRETFLEAYGEIAGSQAKLSKAWEDKPSLARASVEAARLTAVMAGVVASGRGNQGTDAPPQTQINIFSPEFAERVLRVTSERAVDVEARDVTDDNAEV